MRIRKKDVLALDIGTHSTKIVEGYYNGALTVYQYGIHPELGICMKDGIIQNRKEYIAQLRQILETYPYQCRSCNVSFTNSHIFIRNFILPKMKDDEITDNLFYEMTEYLSIDKKDYVLDYKIIDEFDEKNRKGYQVMAAAMEKETVMAYLDMLKQAGLKPKAVDVNINARNKIITYLLGAVHIKQVVLGLIDMGHSITNVSILAQGKHFIHKNIPWGAEEIKNAGEDKDSANHFAMEVKRVFDFYESQNMDKPITKILFLGGGSMEVDIDRFSRRYFHRPVSLVSEIDMHPVGNKETIMEKDYPIIFNALGLCIREDN